MPLNQLDLDNINKQLKGQAPTAILEWALSLKKKAILTTSFGFYSAVSLNALVEAKGGLDVPVVWVDSGYNVKDAYEVAQALKDRLKIDLHVFNPEMSSERRNALMGGIPAHDEPLFDEFVRQVKLEPFERALDHFKPDIWISGIRQEETEHRKNLDIVTLDQNGILKVSPLFYWKEQDLVDYLEKNKLPNCKHYFDPTKVQDNLECGLHTFTPKAS